MAYVRPEVPSQNFQRKREFKTTGNIEQKLPWSIQGSNSKSVVSIRCKGDRTVRNTKTGKPVLTCQQTTIWKKLSFDKRQRQMHCEEKQRHNEAENWEGYLLEVSGVISWRKCPLGGTVEEGWIWITLKCGWRGGKYPGVNESCIWEVGTSAQYGLSVWVWTVKQHSTQTGGGRSGHRHLLPCDCRSSSPYMQVLTGIALGNEPFLAYRSHLTVASLALLCAVQKSGAISSVKDLSPTGQPPCVLVEP